MVIFACSEFWWPNGSQRVSGGTFQLVQGSGVQMVLREAMGCHFRVVGSKWQVVRGKLHVVSGSKC